MKIRLHIIIIVLSSLCLSKIVSAENFSIVIMGENEALQQVASGVTETAIATYPAAKNIELSGYEKFLSYFNGSTQATFTCLDNQDCIQKVAKEKQIDRLLYGLIQIEKAAKGKKKYTLKLNLFNPKSKTTEATYYLESETNSFMPQNTAGIIEQVAKYQKEHPVLPEKPQEKIVKTEPKPQIIPAPQPQKPPEPKTDYFKLGAYSSLGLGLVLGITGTVFGGLSSSAYQDYQNSATQSKARDFLDKSESKASTANIMFISSGILITTGAALWAIDHFNLFNQEDKK